MRVFVTDKYTVLTALLIAAVIAASAVWGGRSISTGSEIKALPIYSVERSDRKISVTFDCAWGAEDVDEVLSALKQHDCRATFFVLGTWAESNPDAIKKIAAEGHELANHSYNHTYYTSLTSEQMKADMERCDSALEALIGKKPRLFRPPAGDYNSAVVNTVNENGKACVQWDTDSLDYKDLTAAQMEERIMSRVQNGSIILFHTGTANTASALGGILSRLKGEGYEFVPACELIYYDNYVIDHTGRQSAAKEL